MTTPRAARRHSEQIKVSQVGYLSHAPKFALLTNETASEARIIDVSLGKSVLTVAVSPQLLDPDTGDQVSRIDFSQLTEPGIYEVEIEGLGRSYTFAIDSALYEKSFRMAMRSFYGQRCGMAVSLAPDFPEYTHEACHSALAQFDSSSGKAGEIDVSGGWHDAGDYGRYIVNSGITMGTLFWTWDLYGSKLRNIGLDIPESGGALSDFLAEVKYNLDWMLKLQDPDDGGVWHKATTPLFCPFVMPEADNEMPMLVIGSENPPHKVTTATADFAAVCASASRIYREFDPQYADKCLAAAEHAWQWLDSNEDNLFHNPPHIKTGGYGDNDASDERLWAAAELFRATGKDEYHAYFKGNYAKWDPPLKSDRLHSWRSVENMAMYAYLWSPSADPKIKVQIDQAALNSALEIAQRIESTPYQNPMLPKDYVWGSNSDILNYAMMMLLPYELHKDQAQLREFAFEPLHYVFGRNTFNTSFVTQLGSKWPMNAHHRPSGADGIPQPWPGLLLGGPNARGKEKPASHWADNVDDPSYTENAINWQAPLMFVLAAALPE